MVITYLNYVKIKVDSYDSFSLEKLISHYILLLKKSVFNKDEKSTTIIYFKRRLLINYTKNKLLN